MQQIAQFTPIFFRMKPPDPFFAAACVQRSEIGVFRSPWHSRIANICCGKVIEILLMNIWTMRNVIHIWMSRVWYFYFQKVSLMTIGGLDLNGAVRGMVNRLCINDVQCQCNWDGKVGWKGMGRKSTHLAILSWRRSSMVNILYPYIFFNSIQSF